MTYAEKLKDPRWQKRRLEILNYHNYTCSKCLNGIDDGVTLHVHHTKYIDGFDPWEYSDCYLTVLCEDCHKIERLIEERKAVLISKIADMGDIIPKHCPACGGYNVNSVQPYHYHCITCGYHASYKNPEEEARNEREYQEYLKIKNQNG